MLSTTGNKEDVSSLEEKRTCLSLVHVIFLRLLPSLRVWWNASSDGHKRRMTLGVHELLAGERVGQWESELGAAMASGERTELGQLWMPAGI